jgi:hypothetical protein
MSSGSQKLSEAYSKESSESSEEIELAPARVDKALCRFTREQASEFHNTRASGGKRVGKHLSHLTFEEKCTIEFLYGCGMMQAIMSDTFHRRANSLPPADPHAPNAFPISVTTKADTENIRNWLVLAGKFKSWMWRTCNEGPSLNFAGCIPARFVPHVAVVGQCNLIVTILGATGARQLGHAARGQRDGYCNCGVRASKMLCR